jgi:osmotically-inducible protein OsmY
MRAFFWTICVAGLALAGCNQAEMKKPAATSPSETHTLLKPAIGGGETPATGATADNDAAAKVQHSAPAAIRHADNTAVNQRDSNPGAVLPTDQGNDQRDLETTAEIRRRILRNTEMSIKGQNVKIITAQGQVTLRGPVVSETERKLIEQIARDVAGPDKVACDLEVAP